MANFAFVENNLIVGVYDNLPKNWKNISNFNVLATEEIYQFGWRVIKKDVPIFDPTEFKIDNPRHELIDDDVYEKYDLISLPKPIVAEPIILTEEEILVQETARIQDQWNQVRGIRDTLMRDFEWRYTRYFRQQRLNLETTDTIENLDSYMQQLADITTQPDPFNIVWPSFTENEIY